MTNLNPNHFNDAYEAARRYPGMGDLKLSSNPYEGTWKAEISFSDGSRYVEVNKNINMALALVAEAVHSYRREHFDVS
jgi:hypothetical protein